MSVKGRTLQGATPMKNIYIKFVNFNGKRHYFVYEDSLDNCVHNGSYTAYDEQIMFYDLIYSIIKKYGYGKVHTITIDKKLNDSNITYLVEVK